MERSAGGRAQSGDRVEGLTASPAVDLTPADRERLMTLGADLERAWSSAGVAPETRKRIVRTLIDEIVVRVEDNVLDQSHILELESVAITAVAVRRSAFHRSQ